MSPVLRVLILDGGRPGSPALEAALRAQPSLEVVAGPPDGASALPTVQALRPDVVVLDWGAGPAAGLAAIEQIMAFCPTPILVVGADSRAAGVPPLEASVSAGAVDLFDEPAGPRWAARLATRVRLVARVKVITHPRARLTAGRPLRGAPLGEPARGRYDLVAIGASTGGPAAMASLLRQLPTDFPLPVLLVMHLGDAFGERVAEWLGGLSALPVALAEDGMAMPPPGRPGVWLAPPGRHLRLAAGRLRLTMEPERRSCRPSVDVLFESVAEECGPRAIGCLLTGMGRDGAEGLLAIRRAGGATIAQDEATSVVYGMPRAAHELGAAGLVLGLDRLGAALQGLAAGHFQGGSRP